MQRYNEVVPLLKARADKVVKTLRNKYATFQDYARGNVVFDYIDAVTVNTFDRVSINFFNYFVLYLDVD